jgi:hypothetical protein
MAYEAPCSIERTSIGMGKLKTTKEIGVGIGRTKAVL